MTPGPRLLPAPDTNGPRLAFDSQATIAKYNAEREKRMLRENSRRYIDPTLDEKYRHFVADPWIEIGTPVNHKPLESGKAKFLIVGAGWAGILDSIKLLKAGFSLDDIVIIDPAGGFGGTWYWNRYPGLMCDVESYIYFPLLEETGYMPKRKYSSGLEIRSYTEDLCRKYGLYQRAVFQSRVEEWTWAGNHWLARIREAPKGGEQRTVELQTNYVLLATGPLAAPHLPDVPGFDRFEGETFHTSRWDYNITGGSQTDPKLHGLEGKKVAFLGTGATAIQAVPNVAKYAKELFVIQRTPSSVDERNNRDTGPEEWKKIAYKPGWQRERNINFARVITDPKDRPRVDLVNDGFSHFHAGSALMGGPQEVTMDNLQEYIQGLHALDFPRQERIRKRAELIVKDQEKARRLQAWYPTWCKRPTFHDEYLPAFNQLNVRLVDSEGAGMERLTERGFVVAGEDYEVDVLILGTGFVSPAQHGPAGKARITVTGRDGKDLEDVYKSHELESLHGVMAVNFPDLILGGSAQGFSTTNYTFILDTMSDHYASIFSTAESQNHNNAVVIEPTREAHQAWTGIIARHSLKYAAMAGCTPGYFNLEGATDRAPVEVRAKRGRMAPFAGVLVRGLEILEGWRGEGRLEGLSVGVVGV
ncbi:FAD/NAD(P)-binding domain-containing protein [Teratosphaeria nubilosa]|uniref:FAD/NAD(P)-binding domain-containing protein n=1 Tax=Teratosphaeria nubilosa TaxID=161662 RepID=A0A6G1KSM3_9PEZI|nr:FAD/NAD(P)-binding domain-containing protein [Teratosphaeria nubilosa]